MILPFFSVIIPTFNRRNSLIRALESLQLQTFKDFEVIVWDDGSTDQSSDVITMFPNLNLKYFWTPNWGGPARPRNQAAKNSLGVWLCFLDADDWWNSDKLITIFKSIGNSDLVFHNLQMKSSDPKTNKILRGRSISKEKPFEDLMIKGNCIPTSSCCIKRVLFEELGGFDENKVLIAVEDFDLWLRAARSNVSFLHIDDSLGYYWSNSNQISAPSTKFIESINFLEQKHRKYLPLDKSGRSAAHFAYIRARMHDRMQNCKVAFQNYFLAFKCGTFIFRIKSAIFMFRILVINKSKLT